VLALGRHDPVANDGAADADLGLALVELEVQALEGDRLADPQAGCCQELEEWAVAFGCHHQDCRELVAAEDLDLLVGQLLAVRHPEALGRVVAD
jgi:hypothetical protein